MAKHAKKMMRSEKKLSGVRKPARKTSKIFGVYIYRVLKQVHPELGISSKAMEVMNNFMQDIFHRLSEESAGLVKFSRKSTLTSSDIQTAARLALPGELAKHAVSEGTKAVARFLASKKESVLAPVARGQPPALTKRVQQEPRKEKEVPPAKRVAKEGMATAAKAPPPPMKGIPPQPTQKVVSAKNLAEAKRRQQQEEARRAKEEQEKKRQEEAEAKKREAEAKKQEQAEAKKQQAELKKQQAEAKKLEEAEAKKRKQEETEAKKREEAEAKKRKQEEAEAIKRKKLEEEDKRKATEESKKGPEEEEEEEADEDRERRSPTPPRETQVPDSTSQSRPVEFVIPIRPEKRSSLRNYRKQQGEGPEADVIRIEAHVPEPTPSSQESLPESSQESALSYTMEPSSQETDSSQRTDFSSDYGTQESSFTSETLEGDRQTVVTVTYTRVTATAVVTTPGGRNRSRTSEHSFAEADQNTEENETAA